MDCELAAPEAWGLSSLVMVNSDGSLAELLCLRRLLVGPWKSLGDVCRERLRGVDEPFAVEFWGTVNEPD